MTTWLKNFFDPSAGRGIKREAGPLERLFLALVAGSSLGLLAGLLEVMLVCPLLFFRKWGFSYSYLLYLALPAVIYGLCGILLGLMGTIVLRAISGIRRRRIGINRYSLILGLSGVVLLVLFLLRVYHTYPSGQRGALLAYMGPLSMLLFTGFSLFIFLGWNRLLLAMVLRGSGYRNGMIIGMAAILSFASYLLIGDLVGNEGEKIRESSRSVPVDTERDNILLITIDTQRADHFGCYGNESILSPSIDRFAEEGVMFRYCIAQSPLTLPSHTSIMTSTYPFYHRVRTNGHSARSSLTTLAEVVGEEGYRTAAFASAFVLDDRFGLDQGFEVYNGNFDQLHLNFLSNFMKNSIYQEIIRQLDLMREDYLQRRGANTTDSAIAWLDAHREEPFFVWIHYFDPHSPWDPISPYDSLYAQHIDRSVEGEARILTQEKETWMPWIEIEKIKSLYMGEVTYTDYQIGRLRDALVDMELAEKTLVVITADHGESFAENNYWGHGGAVNDPSIHVPLIWSRPGRIPEGVVKEGLCESVDIMPTILDYLGIEVDSAMHGKSLLPFMTSGSELPERTGYSEAIGTHDVEKGLRALVTRDWKYTYHAGDGSEKLYLLREDPGEERDLISTHPEKAGEMKDELFSILRTLSSVDTTQDGEMDEVTKNALRALGYVQ
jgi:arylsulfatase A-like enzyme